MMREPFFYFTPQPGIDVAKLASLSILIHDVETLSYFIPHSDADVGELTSLPVHIRDTGTLAHTPSYSGGDVVNPLLIYHHIWVPT